MLQAVIHCQVSVESLMLPFWPRGFSGAITVLDFTLHFPRTKCGLIGHYLDSAIRNRARPVPLFLLAGGLLHPLESTATAS
jgi:hypothetical protein